MTAFCRRSRHSDRRRLPAEAADPRDSAGRLARPAATLPFANRAHSKISADFCASAEIFALVGFVGGLTDGRAHGPPVPMFGCMRPPVQTAVAMGLGASVAAITALKGGQARGLIRVPRRSVAASGARAVLPRAASDGWTVSPPPVTPCSPAAGTGSGTAPGRPRDPSGCTAPSGPGCRPPARAAPGPRRSG